MTQPPPYDPEQPPAEPPPSHPTMPPPPAGWGQAPPPPGWGPAQAGGPAAPTAWGAPAYGAPYAHWIKRVGATLVDSLVVLPVAIVVLIGFAVTSGNSGVADAIGAFLIILGYLAMFGVSIWNSIIRQGQTGWSLGKQVLGIRLIGERTGQPIGPGLTFVRALAHILDSLPCDLGYLWPLWDPKRQTFADKVMSTVVIEQKKG